MRSLQENVKEYLDTKYESHSISFENLIFSKARAVEAIAKYINEQELPLKAPKAYKDFIQNEANLYIEYATKHAENGAGIQELNELFVRTPVESSPLPVILQEQTKYFIEAKSCVILRTNVPLDVPQIPAFMTSYHVADVTITHNPSQAEIAARADIFSRDSFGSDDGSKTVLTSKKRDEFLDMLNSKNESEGLTKGEAEFFARLLDSKNEEAKEIALATPPSPQLLAAVAYEESKNNSFGRNKQ